MQEAERGRALTILAVAFALLAVSNLLKPFQLGGEQTGFVLLGMRLGPAGSAVAGPVFGVFLLFYAASIWRMRRIALTLAWVYAAYVIVNLALFTMLTPTPQTLGYAVFGVVYTFVAIGGSLGAAWLLARRKHELH